MEIILNNNKEHFNAEQLTVSGLLAAKTFTFRMLIVKINDKLVPKDEYGSAMIRDGDNVTVLHLISGG
jgi:thiamine biosynthesis protein ThiS